MGWAAALGIAAPLIGGIGSSIIQKRENEKEREFEGAQAARQEALQKEFAQMGVRWKVADAEAAGLHPLAALGATGASYTPATLSGGADHSMSDMVRGLGQDIGRASAAVQTDEQRQMSALQLSSAKADLDGKLIDNQIRARELQKLQGPSFPSASPGTDWGSNGNVSAMSVGKPLQRTNTSKEGPWMEGAHVADVGWARTKTGVAPIPSSDVKERIEDQFIPETMWAIRNQISPNWGGGTKPPMSMLPKGASDWTWSHTSQEYQPVFNQPETLKRDRARQFMKSWKERR